MWIDTHCHLQFDSVGMDALDRALAADVDQVVCVGTDYESSKAAIYMANQRPDVVSATIGLHPHDAVNGITEIAELLQKELPNKQNKIVGIGECGLDYFYEHSPRNIQKEIFAIQIELAKRNDLALVVHTRNAWDDTFEILRSEGPPPRTVIHCFTGGPDEAKMCLDLGFYLSFSGIVTFKKSTEVQAAAHICPVERMTIETDSPFLAPPPFRGKTNEPTYVGIIGNYLAELKNKQVDEFAEAVSRNAKAVFNLH
jgi:TatD DNase family protein